MGWSCSAEADKVMRHITQECLKQTGQQNVYKEGGHIYMWEIDAVEHDDGSIRGHSYRFNANGSVTKAGAFKISGDGKKITGFGKLALSQGPVTPKIKKEQFKLQKYQYNGWHNISTAESGEIVYVDLANKHPDSMKKLLWGYRKSGEVASGDYIKFFTKVGSPVTFEFEQTGKSAMEEQGVRGRAIQRAIKSGRI